MHKIFSILIFLLILGLGLRSQTPDNSIKLYGEVIDDAGNVMVHTHIVNITSNIGTLTNKEGQFMIHVSPEDTVKISSLGYKSKLLLIPYSDDSKLHRKITLMTDTLALSEAIIYPYPATLEALRKEFLIVEIEEESPAIELHLEMAGIETEPQTGVVISGPFTGLYNSLSRQGKIAKKHKTLVYKEQLRIKSTRIYTAALVKKITGLSTEEETKKFMEFCNLEPEFILNSNEYELYSAINDCFIEFIKTTNK